MKYQLLLRDALKYTERAKLFNERDELNKAVQIMLVVPKAADDMMNVGRLQGFPAKLTAQGKLLKQGALLVADITSIVSSSFELKTIVDAISTHTSLLDKHALQVPKSLAQYLATALNSSELTGGGNKTNLATSVGSAAMGDEKRLLLAQLLANVKLKERQVFLFEQTIIFSEVHRKFQTTQLAKQQQQAPSTTLTASVSASTSASTSAPANDPQQQQQQQQQQHLISSSLQSTPTNANVSYSFVGVTAAGSVSGAEESSNIANCSSSLNQQQQQEQIQIQAQVMHSPFAQPAYKYKNHLSINKIALIDKIYGQTTTSDELKALLGPLYDHQTECKRFLLKSKDPNQENALFLLQAFWPNDRDDWVQNIRSMLEYQLDFLRALQSPIAYQRGLSKDGSQLELTTSLGAHNTMPSELRKTLSNPPAASIEFATANLNQQQQLNKQLRNKQTPTFHKAATSTCTSTFAFASTSGFGNTASISASAQRTGSVKASSATVGNGKYLRYVRAKLSKTRLNLVLNLNSNSSNNNNHPPTGSYTSCAGARDIAADSTATASSGVSVNKSRQQSDTASPTSNITTTTQDYSSVDTESANLHFGDKSSLAKHLATRSLTLTSQQELENQNENETEIETETGQILASKKSTFFHSFRYTLKSRRNSKQQHQPQRPLKLNQEPSDKLDSDDNDKSFAPITTNNATLPTAVTSTKSTFASSTSASTSS